MRNKKVVSMCMVNVLSTLPSQNLLFSCSLLISSEDLQSSGCSSVSVYPAMSSFMKWTQVILVTNMLDTVIPVIDLFNSILGGNMIFRALLPNFGDAYIN